MLSPPVVLDEFVDLDVLTELDLTGAGIAAVVRSAALAAHHDDRSALRMTDLVRAVSRHFEEGGPAGPLQSSARTWTCCRDRGRATAALARGGGRPRQGRPR